MNDEFQVSHTDCSLFRALTGTESNKNAAQTGKRAGKRGEEGKRRRGCMGVGSNCISIKETVPRKVQVLRNDTNGRKQVIDHDRDAGFQDFVERRQESLIT